jgi:hypothetical protein
MTDEDLRKRASWLNGVARRVTSPDVSALLRGYARDLSLEADRMETRSRLDVYSDPRRPDR